MNPKHYRFPRTYRDAFGGEQMAPLSKRITFLHGHRDGLVGLVVAVIILALVMGWLH